MTNVAAMDYDSEVRAGYRDLGMRELPRVLARLAPADRKLEPGSTADQHMRLVGHQLAFGCCSARASDAVKEA